MKMENYNDLNSWKCTNLRLALASLGLNTFLTLLVRVTRRKREVIEEILPQLFIDAEKFPDRTFSRLLTYTLNEFDNETRRRRREAPLETIISVAKVEETIDFDLIEFKSMFVTDEEFEEFMLRKKGDASYHITKKKLLDRLKEDGKI
jgi:hypothetical protein